MNEIELFIAAFAAFAGALALIATALKNLDYLKSKAPTTALKEELDVQKEKLRSIERRLDVIEAGESQRKEQAEELNKSINLLGLALSSALSHMIDGNSFDQMKKERAMLDAHFYKKGE